MAHFAKLNKNNIVIGINVVNNQVLINEDGIEEEEKGVQFLSELHEHNKWKQCSYNGSMRKNYPGFGFKYDETKDAFIPPKPFSSFVLNEQTCLWESTIPEPIPNNPNEGYVWDEDNLEWVQINL